MDKATARKLVKDTLQNSFDKDKFYRFIRELLNHFEDKPFVYRGKYIREAYAPYIQSLERIGKYQDSDGKKIDILIAKLKKESSLERARTMQRNFIAWYLTSRDPKDAALVAFVAPDSEDWRFSLVTMEYKFTETPTGKPTAKEEFTPARRFSFLVGANEASHTAQSSLVPIIADDEYNPTLKDLEEAFNIEKATKEFFQEYRELYNQVKETLDKVIKKDKNVKKDFETKGIDSVDFSKKLLGQIVFLYFLQKKGWFGVKRRQEWGSGSKHFLRELFEKKHRDYKNFFNDILEPLFYEALRLDRPGDYYHEFDCRIPFLNGGLFDPLNDYDWVETDILLPNELFGNKEKTKEGDKGTGILDIFDRYNFTVKEDEPLEKEVAVDPEMLGKVFENLLEVKDRKSKGTYYTPREIVHYMCQESLANYLATELDGKFMKDDIDTLIKYGETVVEHDSRVVNKGRETKAYSFKLPESVRDHAKLIDEKLASIRVCDPAVGSGAFPVGMMNEIVRARNALTSYIGKNGDRTNYHFKRHAIQECLYGVDIDPSAIEIAKLRLWLSLVVDEEDRRTIQPLPNLDYKIVCGNSLLGVDKNLFNTALFRQLEKVKPLYFNETSPSKKRKYKKQIDDLIGEITNGHKDFDFEVYFSEVFHAKQGFDVVIANPPYVEHKKLKALSNIFKKSYSTYSGTSDIYVYFYERGINILRKNGILTYISSNKFFRTRYGEKLRGLLSSLAIQQIIDFRELQIFDALVASCVLIVIKRQPAEVVTVTNVTNCIISQISLADYIERNHHIISLGNLGTCIWQLDDNTKLAVKKRIEDGSIELGSVEGISIYRGITTGYNPAFIITDKSKNQLIQGDKKNANIIKPLLQGRDIKKWLPAKSRAYILFIPWHFPLHKDRTISGAFKNAEKIFKIEYTTLYNYIFKYKRELSGRNKEETGIRYEWYALQRCANTYYEKFENDEKIIWGLTADKWAFAYDNKQHFLPSNGYILTSDGSQAIKYLLTLLNSSLLKYYFRFVGIMTAGGAYTLKQETISTLPVKCITTEEQKQYTIVADKILTITREADYMTNIAKQAIVRDYEKEIDQLVYKLYGLTPEEIKIVED